MRVSPAFEAPLADNHEKLQPRVARLVEHELGPRQPAMSTPAAICSVPFLPTRAASQGKTSSEAMIAAT